MSKKLLFTVLLILIASNVYPQTYGHFITNGNCFKAFSVIGPRQNLCNCPPTNVTFVFGGIITAIAECRADSLTLQNYPLPELPRRVDPEYYSTLIAFRKYLEGIGQPETIQMSEIIKEFIKALQNKNKDLIREYESQYVQLFQKLDPETKEEIIRWLDYD